MKETSFRIGITFESNTLYRGDAAEYHIFQKDTETVDGLNYIGIDNPISVGFNLKNLENVTIDLGGAALIFHGRIAPFLLRDCKNITLTNFSIDYDRPFYSQAEILEASTTRLRLKPDPNFPCGYVNGVFSAIAPEWTTPLNQNETLITPFDPVTSAPSYLGGCILATFADSFNGPKPPIPMHFLKERTLDDGTWEWTGDFPDTWKPGHILTFTHEPRDKNSIYAADCDTITVENVRLIHGASMGFVGMFTHDITLRRFDMYLDDKTKGIVSINADSVHCFHCTGTVLIEDCIFENMLDDAINVHGNYTRVTAVAPDCLHAQCIGHHVVGMHWYKAGDQIVIHKGATIEPRREYRVKNAEYPEPGVICLTLEGDDYNGIEPGDAIENMAEPELIIRRCTTGKNRPRGFLLSSGRRTLVEDCYFNNCCCAIHFTSDMTFWFESGPVRDVTIRHCHFHDCNYSGGGPVIIASPEVPVTDAMPYVHSGITIEDNLFESYDRRLVWAADTKDLVFRNNRFVQTHSYPAPQDIPAGEDVPVFMKKH